MKSITLRIKDEENKLIRDYAKAKNMSVSELIRQSVVDKIEDEIDLEIYNQAIKEYNKDPKDISFHEVMEDLGLYD